VSNPLRHKRLIEAERQISDAMSHQQLAAAEENGAAVVAMLYGLGCINHDEAEHARQYLATSVRTVRTTLMRRAVAA